jgi:uncharacterized repeat protein (TIGR01451 family)
VEVSLRRIKISTIGLEHSGTMKTDVHQPSAEQAPSAGRYKTGAIALLAVALVLIVLTVRGATPAAATGHVGRSASGYGQVGPQLENEPYPDFSAVELQATDGASEVRGPQSWVTLLCRFSDVTAEPQGVSFFREMFERASGPDIDDYWREVSYDNTSVSTDVFGWYVLPQPRSGYGFSESTSGYNAGQIAGDCASAADADVDFAAYDGIAVMLNSPSPVAIWTGFFTVPDGAFPQFGAITMPSNKWNLAIVAHEMGHGFGLPHSYGGGTEYNDPWDVMGIPSGYRCSVNADPVYGCLGQHTIAYFKDQLGWIPAERKFIPTGGQETITLEQLAQPQTDNYLMAWIETAPGQGYTVEARRRVGYDSKLAGDAVIIHRLPPSGVPDLVDADGGATDDAGAMWTPGETFEDPANGITIHVAAATATGFVLDVSTPLTEPDFSSTLLSAKPIAPSSGDMVTFTTRLINHGATASGVVVNMSIPNDTDYLPGSASTSQGTVSGTGPLAFTVGDVPAAGEATLSFAAVVRGDVVSPTLLTGAVNITWEGGGLDLTHRVVANPRLVYLPLILR